MAKRIDPYPSAAIPQDFYKFVRAYEANGVNIAKKFVEMPELDAAYIAEQAELYTAAYAGWANLHTWKKSRWAICAIKTWGDFVLLKGVKGYSGFTLYLKCWLEQRPEANHQPISPCSARVTDPEASPWNYQP